VSKLSKPSPTESPLLFEVDPEPLPEILTALGGVPLVVQTFRSLGLPALVKEHVRIKERQRGYDEATLVESFVILNAVGGECIDDFVRLREDAGLSELVGHQMPSPSVARKFLYEFHEEAKIEEAKRQRKAEQIAYIPEETEALQGLGLVNRGLVRELLRELKRELRAKRLPVVATGGYGELIATKMPEILAVDPLSTLEGLRLVWQAHAGKKPMMHSIVTQISGLKSDRQLRRLRFE